LTGFPLPLPNGTGVALVQRVSISNRQAVYVKLETENSLGHFLLLLLPLTSLQIEKSIDFLLFCLRIVQLQDIIVNCVSSTWCCTSNGRFGTRGISSIDGHLAGDISSSAAFTGPSCGQSASDN